MERNNLIDYIMSDTILKIKINNNQPIELLELTRSMMSLATQYSRYVEKNTDYTAHREAKLLVQEVKSGCIEFDLVELVSVAILPFMENTNTIVDFANLLKKSFNYFIKGIGEKPDVDINDLKDMNSFVAMTANDTGSNTNISTIVKGDVNIVLNIDSANANAFQNILKKEILNIQGISDSEIRRSVLFTWYQTKNPTAKGKGNKGVIEDISKKALNVFFEDDVIKQEMLGCSSNPFKMGYVVDVKPQESKGLIVAYKILRVHEQFEID